LDNIIDQHKQFEYVNISNKMIIINAVDKHYNNIVDSGGSIMTKCASTIFTISEIGFSETCSH